ncbi:zinc finger CCHC domain-containing protein 3-like [Anneissia japonica]|uniref:zinc finger CCHC domain-containing protein 3-like n=1 Tax=Anneissia japonica TaxID=1529436 RepID=UPI00142575AF|nr:zinc finger CCHC domain-containing protein 3-like [Anneissia japonica]
MRRTASLNLSYDGSKDVGVVFADLRKTGLRLDEVVAVQCLINGSFDVSFKSPVICRCAASKLVSGPNIRPYDSRVTVTVLYVEFEVPDSFVRCVLSRYGEVLDSRMLSHRAFPSVLNGNRQYLIDLKENIPSQVRIGSRYCWVSYWGQPRTCLRCGEESHMIRECERKKCNRCFQLGHVALDCTNDIVCSICSASRHVFRNCPVSFSAKARGDRQDGVDDGTEESHREGAEVQGDLWRPLW